MLKTIFQSGMIMRVTPLELIRFLHTKFSENVKTHSPELDAHARNPFGIDLNYIPNSVQILKPVLQSGMTMRVTPLVLIWLLHTKFSKKLKPVFQSGKIMRVTRLELI